MSEYPYMAGYVRLVNQSASRSGLGWTTPNQSVWGGGTYWKYAPAPISNNSKMWYQITTVGNAWLTLRLPQMAWCWFFYGTLSNDWLPDTHTHATLPSHTSARKKMNTRLTFWQVLHALKCNFKLKRISKRTRVVQHSNIQHLYFGHTGIFWST